MYLFLSAVSVAFFVQRANILTAQRARHQRAYAAAHNSSNSSQVMVVFETSSEDFAVVGDHPAIGKWKPQQGIKAGETCVFPSGARIEYKWIEKCADDARWEHGENRVLTLPTTASDDVRLKLTVQDAAPAFEEPVQVAHEPSFNAAAAAAAPHQPTSTAQQQTQQHYAPPAPAAHAPAAAAAAATNTPDDAGEVPGWYVGAVVYCVQTLGFCGVEGPPANFDAAPRLEMLINDGWLQHIASLGCTVLYLGPLMETSSELGHGYDTKDYFSVDPRLGSVDTLRRVVAAAHDAGLRVIVDGVFNHTGRDHFACRDVLENGRASQYWDWFYAHEGPHGVEIEGWEGHHGLPRLNHANPAVRQHLIDAGRFWLSAEGAGIDGWRLDVAHEVDPGFWREFASACRAERSDCLLLAELMHGDYNTHVGPGLLNSGINYQLSKALWSSLNDKNYFELAHSLDRDDSMYGHLVLTNFIGNHDTPRIASRLSNPNEHYMLAAASLLFARGTPCLYYGDELGLEGAPGGPLGDNAMRQKVDLRETLANGNAHARFEATSRLVHLRQSHAALRDATSAQTTLVLTNETFAFARKSSCGATALVAFNCSGNAATVHLPVGEKVGMADGTMLSEPLGGSGATAHSGMIALDLPPNSVRVL
eukprot:CAMPEP_0205951674 /NCGR_PEP_ID=MMETSP1459-20131121/3097_1 /ASSEMBLY_ACC=CAM_ASM_001120 /TAXON_ID=41880 /ORGANISM="Pycnococcus provasolii, Strain RCC931" /LENGTH=647 /DNA_ID=CAMNT_0053323401 /DNA_START=93 /DNA_END=2034 /DNA_ORIENTATION=+